MANDPDLEKIRAEIDAIDEQLLRLISDRARLAAEIAGLKRNESGGTNDYYRPEREARVLREIIRRNTGPLASSEVARLFREIMSACLALEQPLDIAYLGPRGTFSEAAALKHFGHSVRSHARQGIDEVFRDVEAGACHYGVVPVENSIEGAVNQTLDLLIRSSPRICGEVHLRVHHNLMGKAGRLEDIGRVYSHQQSLAQCRAWLDNNLPGAERIAVSSNAEAARAAAAEPDSAAIASRVAAEHYALPVLAANIEDEPDNTTRFLVLGGENARSSGNDKTSVLFSNANQPGALQKSLACFAGNNINMNRIESRPARHAMWEYVFFVDIDGHIDDAGVMRALEELQQHTLMLRVLGSYPAAVL